MEAAEEEVVVVENPKCLCNFWQSSNHPKTINTGNTRPISSPVPGRAHRMPERRIQLEG